jgi:hypothetical protein
MQKHFLP